MARRRRFVTFRAFPRRIIARAACMPSGRVGRGTFARLSLPGASRAAETVFPYRTHDHDEQRAQKIERSYGSRTVIQQPIQPWKGVEAGNLPSCVREGYVCAPRKTRMGAALLRIDDTVY